MERVTSGDLMVLPTINCYIWGGRTLNFGTYKEDAEIARSLVETKTAKDIRNCSI
jgi:hypothetical protein